MFEGLDVADDAAADAFAPVRQGVARLTGLACPWFVAGGWAVDLYLGRVTRTHRDVDVAIYRRDQATLRDFLAAGGWHVEHVVAGRLEPWGVGEWLTLPVHEVHATLAGPAAAAWHLEFLLNEGDDSVWRFRKAPAVTRLRRDVEQWTAGLPYFAPEIPLLYKALTSERRPTDEADFASALPALAPEACVWLGVVLRALAPSHPWLQGLGASRDH